MRESGKYGNRGNTGIGEIQESGKYGNRENRKKSLVIFRQETRWTSRKNEGKGTYKTKKYNVYAHRKEKEKEGRW